MATQKKIDEVAMLSGKVEKAKAIVFADYTGVKHKQLEELRKTLRKNDAEMVVAKNRMIKRALGDRAKDVEKELNYSTAAVFAYGDEVAPLKELLKFFKGIEKGKAKAGFLGSSYISEDGVKKLSDLPGRETLLAMLVGQLQAPIRGLHYSLSWNINKLVWALNGVKNKKG